MRRRHFETLRPLCVVCDARAPLAVARALVERGDDLIEGIVVGVLRRGKTTGLM